MRLVSVGNHRLDYATERHLARDAENAGHQVCCIQEPAGGDPSGFYRQVRHAAESADLLIYTKTYGLPASATRLWRHLEAAGTRTCSFHLDLYCGLPRQTQVGQDPFWTTGTVFTADGDPQTAQYMAARGVNHRWLPPAVVSDETARGQPDPQHAHDVVFVGSRTYHPAWPWRQQLVDHLARYYGSRFRHYNQPQIRGRALNDLYASVKVAVGDSLCLPGHQNYWSDRYFETIGRGGFLCAPEVPGLASYLTAGEHYGRYQAGNLDDVTGQVDRWLDDPAGRNQIRTQGHAHVVAHHTYQQRIGTIIAVTCG